MNVMTLYKGKLTYVLAAVAMVWGLAGLVLNMVNPEVGLSWEEAQRYVWSGLVAFGIRRAV